MLGTVYADTVQVCLLQEVLMQYYSFAWTSVQPCEIALCPYISKLYPLDCKLRGRIPFKRFGWF